MPLGTITAIEYFDNKIRSERDISNRTNVPFLGAVNQKRNKENIVVESDSCSIIAENIRLLRTNLQFQLAGALPYLLITSATSGEGKTFITINLGMSMAISWKKVLLIGLYLRKPKLERYLTKEKKSLGVTSYLVGEADIEDIIYSTQQNDNLHFIPCGPIPPNPAELIMNKRLTELLEDVKKRYDCVIIDTTPVGLVTDAILLRDQVNASIFVTYFGKTRKSVTGLISKLYAENKLPKLSVVLNGIKVGSGYGYSYLYDYRHRYGDYGYYSDQNSGWMNWFGLFRSKR